MRLLLVVLLTLLVAAPAHGYWGATGTGSGTAPVDTLGAGSAPSTSVSGRTVTVSWSQTAFHSGLLGAFAGGGYTLRRYPAAGAEPVTPGTPCAEPVSGSGATLTCTEPSVGFGSWRYSVMPRLDASWTGAESPPGDVAYVRPDAPSVTATATAGGGITVSWPAVTGATAYAVRRRAGGGDLSPLVTVTGTSHADAATADGTSYGYVVRAVAPAETGGTIESADSAEATATADATAPTVEMTDPGAAIRATVALGATAGDAGSGVATVRIQRSPAGTSSWIDVCTTAGGTCAADTTTWGDGLHDLRAIATDAAGNSATSATVTNRRVDNTAPSAALTAPAALLRATVLLTYTTSDGGSGLASVKVQRAPTGTSTWTDICSGAAAASPCSFDTMLAADGVHDLRLLATDAAGNAGTSVVTARTVDNTRPSGTDVQTTIAGAAGLPERNDAITFGFSEPLAPASILAGWSGAATPVTVRISAAIPGQLTVYNAANSAPLPLGSVDLGKQYALSGLTFTGSTMTMTGSSLTVVLGTMQLGGLTLGALGNGTLAWTPVADPTDLAGNAMTTTPVTESGGGDLDF